MHDVRDARHPRGRRASARARGGGAGLPDGRRRRARPGLRAGHRHARAGRHDVRRPALGGARDRVARRARRRRRRRGVADGGRLGGHHRARRRADRVREVLTGLAHCSAGRDWTRTYVRTSIGRMQLRLDAADRLVELVEERRGPVPADEAARLVLKLGRGRARRARALAARRGGSRTTRACAGPATSSRSPARRARRCCSSRRRSSSSTSRRPACGPARRGRARSARCACARLELEERFQTLANPGARLQPAVAALTGPARRRAAARAAGRGGRPALPRLRRRRGPRRAQRALRHGVPRQRDDAADRPPCRRDRRRHGRARAPPARAPAREPRRALVPLRDRRAAVPPRAARTPRRPPRSCSA